MGCPKPRSMPSDSAATSSARRTCERSVRRVHALPLPERMRTSTVLRPSTTRYCPSARSPSAAHSAVTSAWTATQLPRRSAARRNAISGPTTPAWCSSGSARAPTPRSGWQAISWLKDRRNPLPANRRRTRASLPHPSGGSACSGVWAASSESSSPGPPRAVQLNIASRPPPRSTRASSRAVARWRGANAAPNAETTTSKLPSENGSAAASPLTHRTSVPACAASRRPASNNGGVRSSPTTRAPDCAARIAALPVPQATSSTSSPLSTPARCTIRSPSSHISCRAIAESICTHRPYGDRTRLASGDRPMFQRRLQPDTSVRRKSARRLVARGTYADAQPRRQLQRDHERGRPRTRSRSVATRYLTPSDPTLRQLVEWRCGCAAGLPRSTTGPSSSPQNRRLARAIGVTSSLSALVSARSETGAGDGVTMPCWWREQVSTGTR